MGECDAVPFFAEAVPKRILDIMNVDNLTRGECGESPAGMHQSALHQAIPFLKRL